VIDLVAQFADDLHPLPGVFREVIFVVEPVEERAWRARRSDGPGRL